MSDSAEATQRIAIENSLQIEPDGCFLIRPFSVFGSVYEFPNQNARDFYISNTMLSGKMMWRSWNLLAISVFILFFIIAEVFSFSHSDILRFPFFA